MFGKIILPLQEEIANSIAAVFGQGSFTIPLDDLVAKEKEYDRLIKERDRLREEVALTEKKLSNAAFVEKAPKAVVEGEKEKQKIRRHVGRRRREAVKTRIKTLTQIKDVDIILALERGVPKWS